MERRSNEVVRMAQKHYLDINRYKLLRNGELHHKHSRLHHKHSRLVRSVLFLSSLPPWRPEW